MYISAVNATRAVFSSSNGYLKDMNKLLEKPDETSGSFFPVSVSVPRNVTINSATANLNRILAGTESNISRATSRNTLIKSYLGEVKSMLETLELYAENASSRIIYQDARAEFSTKADEILNKIDHYYVNASFQDEYIMRGGTGTTTIGEGGQETVFSYGNLGRSELGIDSIDLSSWEAAETSLEAVQDAINKIEGQYALAVKDGKELESYDNVNQNKINSFKLKAEEDTQRAYSLTVFQNSLAAISSEMRYAMDIQGSELREDTINTIINELSALNSKINSTYDSKKKEPEKSENVQKNKSGNSEKSASENFGDSWKTLADIISLSRNKAQSASSKEVNP